MAVALAVIGHVAWVTHTRGQVPVPGQIVGLDEARDEPAGGGAVTAAQIARLAGGCPAMEANPVRPGTAVCL